MLDACGGVHRRRHRAVLDAFDQVSDVYLAVEDAGVEPRDRPLRDADGNLVSQYDGIDLAPDRRLGEECPGGIVDRGREPPDAEPAAGAAVRPPALSRAAE